jgi:hypothetical protein
MRSGLRGWPSSAPLVSSTNTAASSAASQVDVFIRMRLVLINALPKNGTAFPD